MGPINEFEVLRLTCECARKQKEVIFFEEKYKHSNNDISRSRYRHRCHRSSSLPRPNRNRWFSAKLDFSLHKTEEMSESKTLTLEA